MYRDKVFDQMNLFPGTRYMGSKEKLIKNLYEVFENIEFELSLEIVFSLLTFMLNIILSGIGVLLETIIMLLLLIT